MNEHSPSRNGRSDPGGRGIDRRSLMTGLAVLPTLSPVLAEAASEAAAPEASGFSFAVYGDSRTMMYLPSGADQKEQATQLLVEMFSLVLPEKVARDMVEKDIQLIYAPDSGDLVQIVMPLWTRSEVTTLTVDKGWITEASVEDVKLLPGVRKTVFRLYGGTWVARELAREVQSRGAQFILSTGDFVWWGQQGTVPSENPYWRRVFDNLLDRLPPPDEVLRAAGLPGRVFPAVGNHEVWGDPNVQALLQVFPYLRQFGVSEKRLIYTLDYKGVRFIFLWTGKYDYRSPSSWDAERPRYDAQMAQLKKWLDEARETGISKVFISFHAPAFCRSSIGPVPESQNPHQIIASYARDLEIVVFNGHVHTTELYEVDGVRYMLIGAGGAEQDSILPGRTKIDVPAGYPPDLYWAGASPKEEYNYLRVDVEPGRKTGFTLNRFRPWSSEPFSTVRLFD